MDGHWTHCGSVTIRRLRTPALNKSELPQFFKWAEHTLHTHSQKCVLQCLGAEVLKLGHCDTPNWGSCHCLCILRAYSLNPMSFHEIQDGDVHLNQEESIIMTQISWGTAALQSRCENGSKLRIVSIGIYITA